MRKLLLLALPLCGMLSPIAKAATNPDALSLQDVYIGATPALQASANNGAGVTFGDIDTGITPQWAGFNSTYNTWLASGTSNINTSASAVCLNGVCPTGAVPTDQNGHGTFTASEMVGGAPIVGMEGVAPAASLIAVQVLSASGSGFSNDVANGIMYAVNHGAQVLNLSLGPSGTAAQQAAFYESLASAVNYAASKNAIIVFAGGNNAQAFTGGVNITGFSDLAISHMFFMGSTNITIGLSSFSNTPGTAGFTSTTGKFTSYENMWMMAYGENIWGASNYHTAQTGYTYITQLSGTSMAAPQGAGAAGLLAAKWPFLISMGTIPQILEQSAWDLGASGIDSTFGAGFLNLAGAFQAASALSVPVNGQMVPAGTAQIVSGGALGNMGKVAAAFQSAVGYDKFMRGFPLSFSIASHSSGASISQAAAQAMGQGSAGGRSFTSSGENSWTAFSGSMPDSSPSYGSYDGSFGLTVDPAHSHQAPDWSYEIAQGGRVIGVGQGSTNAALAFGDARWGAPGAFSATNVSASGSLLGLVSGGHFAAMGLNLGSDSRVAASVITATSNELPGFSENPASAQGAAFAYTVQASDRVKVSFSTSYLNETNMLLGSTSNGFLSLSPSANTASFGVGTNIKLGDGYQLGLDAAYATTSPGNNSSSLIGGTSRLASDSFSLALSKDDVSGIGDTLGVSVDKPLRVFSGTANLAVPTGTDNSGNPIVQNARVNLVPTGNETDLGLAYSRPLAQNLLGSFNMTYRNDADNVAGAQDAAAMVHLRFTF